MIRNRVWSSVFLVAAATCGCDEPKVAKSEKSPEAVLVSLPVTVEVTDFEDFTGKTEAVVSVEIRSRVSGYLDKIHFQDGDEVAEDALLFEIDARPYQAAADKAEATLKQNEARTKRLDSDLRRANALLGRGSISREEFDKIASDEAEGLASTGIVKADLDLARLNLSFTKVKAPSAGRLSRRMVDAGNLVKADDTALVSIVSLDPMHVTFDIDERTLLKIRRLIADGKIKSRQEAEIEVMIGLADEPDFPHRGTINFSDNRIDPGTGTLRVRAVTPNPKPRVLSPGLFVRVRLPIGASRRAIVVPEQAVGTDQGKKFVYVVIKGDKDEKVARRPVEVGALRAGMREIKSGVKMEDRVIVSGLQRVRENTKVSPEFQSAERPTEPKVAASKAPAP